MLFIRIRVKKSNENLKVNAIERERRHSNINVRKCTLQLKALSNM